ncbi:MAG TPA: glutaredoxin 3 [Gammaproteobacteria bacterium]|nr:glutaredoxin 3 [Gammaproteobacteria bacterium]
MANVVMYCTATCPYCIRAQRLLEDKGVAFEQIRVDLEPDRRAEMVQRAGGRTSVPQIFIEDMHVGGCDEIYALERAGKLDALLQTA